MAKVGSAGGVEKPPLETPRGPSVGSSQFEDILSRRAGRQEAARAGGVKESLSPDEAKKALAHVLQEGGNTEDVVRTALSGSPYFRDLPAQLREDLIARVAGNMNPILRGRV